MKAKLIADKPVQTYALIFDKGDEIVSTLERFAREHSLGAAHFSAIGALSEATLGYFDWEKKDYAKIPVSEQVEVLSLVGDVALKDAEPKVHAHVVLGTAEGNARGGHLLEGKVRPTLEVVLTTSPSHLRREYDPETGLPLIKIGGGQ